MDTENKILRIVQAIDKRLSSLETTFKKRFVSTDKRLSSIDNRLQNLESSQDKMIEKMLDMDTYMHEELVTKKEFAKKTNEISNQLDGLAHQHKTLDCEQAAIRSHSNRIDERLTRIETVPART